MNNSNIYWAWVDISNNFVLSTMHNGNKVMSDCPLHTQTHTHTHTHLSRRGNYSRLLSSVTIQGTTHLSSDASNTEPQVNPHPLAQSDLAMKRVQRAGEEEEERGRGGGGGGGGGEVSLAREVMRPHRHNDDKDTSGWLSSFKSHRADHHTVNPH